MEEKYREIFNEDDVEFSFTYMLNRLEDMWSSANFSELKRCAKRDPRFSSTLRSELACTSNLEEMLDILSDSEFCNWLDIQILKRMGRVAEVPEAMSLIRIYENCIYPKKCSDVKAHIRKEYVNSDDKIAKLKEDVEKKLTVADLMK